MSRKRQSLENATFGRLTVLSYAGNSKWVCACACGKITTVRTGNLTHGDTRSCGCYLEEERAKRPRTHGQSKTRLYRIWRLIKTRCLNKNNSRYKWYGGRGIQVCEEWAQSFEAFAKWAHENGYAENLTIDRIDNDKGYSPDNCRWASQEVQNANRRNVKQITYKGRTQTLTAWGKEMGIPSKTIWRRIYKDGWNVEKALTVPADRKGAATKDG